MRTVLAVVGLVASLAVVPPTEAAAVVCQGETATIVNTDIHAEVTGTEGDDVIYAGRHATIDAKAGDDKVCFEDGQVFGGAGRDSIRVRGTPTGEEVGVWDSEDLDIRLGAGSDYVQLAFNHGGTGIVDAGRGASSLFVYNASSVDIDLEDQTMALDDDGDYELVGFRRVRASSRRIELTGDGQDNTLHADPIACRITLRGGGGHDHLLMRRTGGLAPIEDCAGSSPHLYGQRGNDDLEGRRGDDVLIGGPGHDAAIGLGGIDKCRAERKRNCER